VAADFGLGFGAKTAIPQLLDLIRLMETPLTDALVLETLSSV
jgi:hypothetical protein